MKVADYGAPKVESSALGAPFVQPLRQGPKAPQSNIAGAIASAAEHYGEEQDREREKIYHADANNLLAQAQDVATDIVHGNALQAAQAQAQQGMDPNADVVQIPLGPGDQQYVDNGAIVPTKFDPAAAAPNAGQGFLASRGKDAAALSVPTLNQLNAKLEAIRKTAGSDQAAALYHQGAMAIWDAAKRTIEDHVTQQTEVAVEASIEARQATALTAIANGYSDASTVADLTASVEQSIRQTVAHRGLGDEVANARVAQFQQQATETRMNQYLAARDFNGAQALFATSRDQLGAKAGQFQHAIDLGKQDVEGETNAQRIVKESTNPVTGWVDPTKALERLDALPPSPVKDETRSRLEHRLAVAHQQKETAITNVFNSALAAYEKGGTLAAVDPRDKAFLQNPANDPKQWEHLRSIARADAEHARGAPVTPDQQSAMTAFRTWVADNPDKAATMTAEEFNRTWVPQFAKRDREQAGVVFAAAHAKENGTQKLAPIEDKLLLQTGREAGVFPQASNDVSKWDDASAQVYYHAIAKITDKTAEYRRANGKPPPAEEVQKWAAGIFLQGTEPGTGWFGTGFREDKTTRIEAEMQGKEFVPKWTEAQIATATKALTGGGMEATDANVDTYLRRANGLPSLPRKRSEPAAPPPNRAMSPMEKR